jgi:hypothetical protein
MASLESRISALEKRMLPENLPSFFVHLLSDEAGKLFPPGEGVEMSDAAVTDAIKKHGGTIIEMKLFGGGTTTRYGTD